MALHPSAADMTYPSAPDHYYEPTLMENGLSLDTVIRTSNGNKTVGDLQAGDLVYGLNDELVPVIEAGPVKQATQGDWYRISFIHYDSSLQKARQQHVQFDCTGDKTLVVTTLGIAPHTSIQRLQTEPRVVHWRSRCKLYGHTTETADEISDLKKYQVEQDLFAGLSDLSVLRSGFIRLPFITTETPTSSASPEEDSGVDVTIVVEADSQPVSNAEAAAALALLPGAHKWLPHGRVNTGSSMQWSDGSGTEWLPHSRVSTRESIHTNLSNISDVSSVDLLRDPVFANIVQTTRARIAMSNTCGCNGIRSYAVTLPTVEDAKLFCEMLKSPQHNDIIDPLIVLNGDLMEISAEQKHDFDHPDCRRRIKLFRCPTAVLGADGQPVDVDDTSDEDEDEDEAIDVPVTIQHTDDVHVQDSHAVEVQPAGTSEDTASVEQELLLPPYYLGAWLGDGTADVASITSIDPEMKDYHYELVEQLNLTRPEYAAPLKVTVTLTHVAGEGSAPFVRTQDCYRYGITSTVHGTDPTWWNPIREGLAHYGLLHDKTGGIPLPYRNGSVEVKAAVLAGLIDTDGWMSSTDSSYTMCQGTLEHRNIALHTHQMAKDLGMRTNIYPYVYSPPDGKASFKKDGAAVHEGLRVRMAGKRTKLLQPYIRLPRKRLPPTKRWKDEDTRTFESEQLDLEKLEKLEKPAQYRSIKVQGHFFQHESRTIFRD